MACVEYVEKYWKFTVAIIQLLDSLQKGGKIQMSIFGGGKIKASLEFHCAKKSSVKGGNF